MTKTFKNCRLFLLLLGLFQIGAAHAQKQNTNAEENSLHSAIFKKNIKLNVRLPDGYSASKSKYAVLYVIHGNNTAVDEMATTAQNLHRESGTPEMIVVGLENNGGDIDGMRENPKAQKFLSFIETELIPYMAKKYRTNGERILHSKASFGSFVLYAFLTKPALFTGYIAATHQWYEQKNDYFTGLANKAFQNPGKFKGRKIFLATLNGAYNNNNIPEVDKQMQEFSELLNGKSGGRVSSRYRAYDDWGQAIRPDFKDCLLFVSTSIQQPDAALLPLTMDQNTKGKWVISDRKKKTLYEVFPYDNGPDTPSEGLFRIVKNGKIGYADATTYTIVIPPQFDCAFPFENGKAKVSNKCKTIKEGEHNIWVSDAWQYVDKLGVKNPPAGQKTEQPPVETGDFKTSDLVELIRLDTTFKLDIRYATDNNFTKRPVYPEARAFLQRPAAQALAAAHRELKSLGFGLLIFDGYRPWSVTKFFWDITPEKDRIFVANPQKGSKHNRGCAVDLTLYELATGKEVQMPGAYDEFSERSFPTYQGGTDEQRRMRDLLRSKMEAQGFTVDGNEWWHFDFNDWKSYRIQNIQFSAIK